MNADRSPNLEVIKDSKENTPDRIELSSTMELRKQIKTWQLAVATILLLGFGFVLGQKSQPQQTTPATVVNRKQTNIFPVQTTVGEPADSYSTSHSKGLQNNDS